MRDLGGIKLHIPTIRDHNPEIASLDLDAYSTKENLEEVWASVYMVVVRCHLEQSVHALGLQNEGGWAVVREALGKVVDGMGPHERARELYEVFIRERLPMSCYLRTKLDPPTQGVYRRFLREDGNCSKC